MKHPNLLNWNIYEGIGCGGGINLVGFNREREREKEKIRNIKSFRGMQTNSVGGVLCLSLW